MSLFSCRRQRAIERGSTPRCQAASSMEMYSSFIRQLCRIFAYEGALFALKYHLYSTTYGLPGVWRSITRSVGSASLFWSSPGTTASPYSGEECLEAAGECEAHTAVRGMTSQSPMPLAPQASQDMQPTMRKNFPDSRYYVTGITDDKKWWHLW